MLVWGDWDPEKIPAMDDNFHYPTLYMCVCVCVYAHVGVCVCSCTLKACIILSLPVTFSVGVRVI